MRSVAILSAIGLALAGTGCSRERFRTRADLDVEGTITQKNTNTAWEIENWHVYPDPRARFADPSCPDYPPYPPDDYAAYILSPNPQKPGRGGAGRFEGDGYLAWIEGWDAQNRAEDAAEEAAEKKLAGKSDLNPDKPSNYAKDDPANPEAGEEFAAIAGGAASYLRTFKSDLRPYRLRLEQSVELGLFNSREFQDRREDLYLAALPVTLERFTFAAQAFATEQIIREVTGRERTEGQGNRWRVGTDVGITRRFSTGAELLVRLANQVVIDLSNGRPDTSISTFALTFTQPLLQGAGFAVTLEALTQAERTLLYAIRSYARFRRIFFFAIAGGGGYTNNPYGLQGLSANLGRGVGANLTANPIGYLPAVLRGATLENQRKNVASLEQFLKLFQNLKEGGGVTELQVVRVEQNLLRGRNDVLSGTRQYLDNLDFFKLQLGVPATVPIELDDGPLKPVRNQLERFERVYDQLRQVEAEAGKFDPKEAPASYRTRWTRLLTDSPLARGTRFAADYARSARELQNATEDALDKQYAGLLEQRRKLLDAKAERELKNVAETPAQVAALDAIEAALDRIRFEKALRRYESRPWLKLPVERQPADQAIAFRYAFETGMLVAVQPRNDRLYEIRRGWPELPPITVDGFDVIRGPFDDSMTQVMQAALINRLDLMNARAQVVDSWRQITVTANALQGVFNVSYNLDSATPALGTNGLGLGGSRTRHQVVLDIEPPFVRRAERNEYRTALISYQRSRRNLMAFEDNVLTDTRQDLRNLRNLAESYKISQRTVELAYAQVDNARGTFVAPPDPAARDTAGSVAALTQQLLEAQSSLVQAQNDLYTVWTNYLIARMELYLDMDLLPLDNRGIWTDDPAPSSPPDAPAPPAPGAIPLPPPQPVP